MAASPSNAEKLFAVLEASGFGNIGLKKEDFLEEGAIVQLGYPPNRIDIVTGISAVTFSDAWKGRVAGTLDGLPVCFIGRDQLLKNRRAGGRPKDLADVDALEDKPPGA